MRYGPFPTLLPLSLLIGRWWRFSVVFSLEASSWAAGRWLLYVWFVVCLWRCVPYGEVLPGLVEDPSFAVLTCAGGMSVGGSMPSSLGERGKGSPLRW